jgi:hypothetical protein
MHPREPSPPGGAKSTDDDKQDKAEVEEKNTVSKDLPDHL